MWQHACASWYAAAVSVTLAATDNAGGSGVSKTYYTTDGTTPTTSSTMYTGAFNVTGTTTVQYFSVDVAGNTEAVKSQLIQFDTTARRPRSPATARRVQPRCTPRPSLSPSAALTMPVAQV